MTTPEPGEAQRPGTHSQVLPLYAAGFVTAFGAHSIAASLGGYIHGQHASLLALGLLLAVYDGAEVALKPVFGSLADRIGPRPVLLAGLLAFAITSGAFVVAGDPAWVGLARFGQGAAAAAFSPAAGVLVSRLNPPSGQGRGFGRYGAWKGLGYTLGPMLGGVLIAAGGYNLLFATLAALGVAVAGWARLAVPGVAPSPRTRQTVADLARRLTSPGFMRPTLALAAAAGALSVGVGFLPVVGAERGLGPLITGVIVSLLAAAAALIQPRAGRAYDNGRVGDRAGLATGLVLAAGGCVAVLIPGIVGLVTAAMLIGLGVGLITPIGFAYVAATAPERTTRPDDGFRRSRSRTRRRRWPTGRRCPRRRRHPHPSPVDLRRVSHCHRRLPRSTHRPCAAFEEWRSRRLIDSRRPKRRGSSRTFVITRRRNPRSA